MDDKEKKINELRWVRVFSPVHIPKYLVEQVRGREFSVEDFYKYQELNCLVETEKGPTLNPFNHLYVTVDGENIVKGFLWFTIDPLSKDMVIHTFSMDKEYWDGGHAVKFASEHVKSLMQKLKLKKCIWVTNYPKHSQKHGFKRSKGVVMEYKGEEDGIISRRNSTRPSGVDGLKPVDGGGETGKEYRPEHTRAAAVL